MRNAHKIFSTLFNCVFLLKIETNPSRFFFNGEEYGSRKSLALLAMPQDGVLREKPSPRVTNNRKILAELSSVLNK